MPTSQDFARIYAAFDAPIMVLDCGLKCAPYNNGVPVCCDTRHSIPTAYPAEWAYLQAHSDLWRFWQPDEDGEHDRLARQAGPDLVLIECLGAERCRRPYRSLVCRSFPFFPYSDSQGNLLGLSGYWEYADRCWVLSNLDRVSPAYRREFIAAYEQLFDLQPDERVTFQLHSEHLRARFSKQNRRLPLLHREGGGFLIDPQDESLQRAGLKNLRKYGPFAIADRLRFPDER